MLAPTAGTIEVLGGRPAAGPAQLARVGYLPQNAPVYAGLTVADHLKLGAHLNPAWDAGLDLDPRQKAGKLSGGQRVQLSLTLAVAKRPELLILDEPVASLDPLARREFLRGLMESVAEQGLSVVLSSHLVGDLERVCDYLIVLVASQVQVAGPVDDLLATHHLLTGPRRDPGSVQVISASHTDVQSTLLVRTCGPVLDRPGRSPRSAWRPGAGLHEPGRRRRPPPPPPGGAEMTWLTWRQFRTQAIAAAAGTAAFAVLLAATGPHLASIYAADGLDSCHGGCASAADYFTGSLVTSPYLVLFLLSTGIILLAPAVIGLFCGAPLIARELETGTAALAWNQSVTRTRWLAVKLAAGALAALAVTEALSLTQTWWEAPISQAVADGGSGGALAQSRFTQLNFATHGVTPLGYAALAFALGVTAGALILRTLPAMALTLAIFAALQVAMPLWVRPNLAPPDHTVLPVTAESRPGVTRPGRHHLHASRHRHPRPARRLDPVQRARQRRRAGDQHHPGGLHSASAATATGAGTQVGRSAPNQPGAPIEFLACLASHGIRKVITYQPGSRYWRFQATETSIYLALALALTGYCFQRINRRLS